MKYLMSGILALFVLLTGFAYDKGQSEWQNTEEDALTKYNLLLKIWSEDDAYYSDTKGAFPDWFAGCYIDGKKYLVIKVTNNIEDAKNYFSKLIDMDGVRMEAGDYSYTELLQKKDLLIDKLVDDTYFRDNVCALGLDIEKNRINIYTYLNEEDYMEVLKLSEYISEIIDSYCFTYVYGYGEDYPISIALTPGEKIPGATSSQDRSVGFWAYKTNGDVGIVTASHGTISYGQEIWINGRKFGVAETPYYSGNVDAVFIKRTNSYFMPSNYILGLNCTLIRGGYTILAQGSSVASKGISSGCGTGTVLDISYTTYYGISDCVRTSIIRQEGDSGGVVVQGGSSNSCGLVGIMTGINLSFKGVYVKAANILSTLGVTVY